VSTTLVGEVTRDPKPPEVPGGVNAVEVRAAFGLCASRSWTHPVTGTTRESTSHFEVRCRGELAENVLASVREGDRVIVMGEIDQREWNGPGNVRSTRTFLMADDVGLALSFHRIDAPTDADDEGDDS